MHIPVPGDKSDLELVLVRALNSEPEVKNHRSPRVCFGPWSPAVDVQVVDKEAVVYIDLPGMDEDELRIDVLPDELTLSGERGFDHDLEDAEEFVRLDRQYGPFEARVELPIPVDPNRATARYRRGVLKIRLPFADVPYRGRRLNP